MGQFHSPYGRSSTGVENLFHAKGWILTLEAAFHRWEGPEAEMGINRNNLSHQQPFPYRSIGLIPQNTYNHPSQKSFRQGWVDTQSCNLAPVGGKLRKVPKTVSISMLLLTAGNGAKFKQYFEQAEYRINQLQLQQCCLAVKIA